MALVFDHDGRYKRLISIAWQAASGTDPRCQKALPSLCFKSWFSIDCVCIPKMSLVVDIDTMANACFLRFSSNRLSDFALLYLRICPVRESGARIFFPTVIAFFMVAYIRNRRLLRLHEFVLVLIYFYFCRQKTGDGPNCAAAFSRTYRHQCQPMAKGLMGPRDGTVVMVSDLWSYSSVLTKFLRKSLGPFDCNSL